MKLLIMQFPPIFRHFISLHKFSFPGNISHKHFEFNETDILRRVLYDEL
jgi:hypothetical protein